MKKMKKILAFAMAMAMVLGMTMTTFATSNASEPTPNPTKELKEATGKSTDTGTISIKGVATGATVKAYQIIEAKYEGKSGTFSGYADKYTIDGAKLVSAGKDTIENINDETMTLVHKYLLENKVAGTTMSESGDSYSADVAIGTYLIEVVSEGKIYGNMVVSTQYVNQDGENKIENNNFYVTNGETWVKVQETPTVSKVIVTGEETTAKGNTANAGDIIKYQITTQIPTYTGNSPVFSIKDTLVGQTYVSNSLKVTVGDAADDVKSSTLVGFSEDATTELNLNFVQENGTYNLSSHAGKTLTITYEAKVDAEAKMNTVANTNKAVLTYTINSNVTGDDVVKTDDTAGTTSIYTFDLDGSTDGNGAGSILVKLDSNDENTKLAGAEFELYQKNGENRVEYTNTAMTAINGITKITSDIEGKLVIKGLAAGTYYLKETKAPEGYSLSDHEYEIVIGATISEESGELTAWTVTVDGSVVSTDGGVKVPNTKLASLPSTGGIGTTIFTIGGCAVMILAAGLYFASRRKSSK